LEVLQRCFPPSVRRTLDDLPESLDETYERILKEIRKPNQEHAHRMLQCLVAAVRPLRVEELAEVLAFDFDADGIPKLNLDWRWEEQEEAIMSACSSLVIIVKDGDSRIVQFSHFSVKEFLTADQLATPVRDVSRYHIQLDVAHTILAQACLVSSSEWTMASTVTMSRTSHWLFMLVSTGPRTRSLRLCRMSHASRVGWSVYLTPATLRHLALALRRRCCAC
jgi:hypothetical protein